MHALLFVYISIRLSENNLIIQKNNFNKDYERIFKNVYQLILKT
jgi:hypothetical protein